MPEITIRSSKDIVKRRGLPGAQRGRPRSGAIDEAVLRAAFRLMGQHGYVRMSIDAIAAGAGVTKPSIYLRFPGGKAEIAAKALAYARDRRTITETGNTRADLVTHLRIFRAGVSRPFGMSMIGSVLAEAHHTPQLLAFFRDHVVRPRRAMIRAVLERARRRGEVRPRADIEIAMHALIGAYYAQYLAGIPFPGDWAERVVDIVLDGLARP